MSGGDEPARLGPAVVMSERKLSLFVRTKEHGAFRVPRSVIHDDSEVYDGKAHSRGELIVKYWWAERELGL